jgi:hypothetical protein
MTADREQSFDPTKMTYTPAKPPLPVPIEQLRARIPGWGADSDPKDRPSVPKLEYQDDLSGAHWEFPERQPEKWPRERSIEHGTLTPVFGTAQPPTGLSGALRRLSYARYSEGRAAHWLLLMLADRVGAFENHVRSLLTLHPDNPHGDGRAQRVHPPRTVVPDRPQTDRPGAPAAGPDHRGRPVVAAAGVASAGVRTLVGSVRH